MIPSPPIPRRSYAAAAAIVIATIAAGCGVLLPSSDGLLVASGGPLQAGLTHVGLDVEDVDLKPYAKAGQLTLATDVTGHNPQNTTTIKATAALNIDVNLRHLVCGNHKGSSN